MRKDPPKIPFAKIPDQVLAPWEQGCGAQEGEGQRVRQLCGANREDGKAQHGRTGDESHREVFTQTRAAETHRAPWPRPR